MSEPSKSEVARVVREQLTRRPADSLKLEVWDSDVIRMSEDDRVWWRVPVHPETWPRRTFEFYEILAEVEEEIAERAQLNILLTTGQPLNEVEEAGQEATAA